MKAYQPDIGERDCEAVYLSFLSFLLGACTKADLNWMDKKARSTVEMNDKTSRPALVTGDLDVSAYDFSGKTVVLFAASGGRPWTA